MVHLGKFDHRCELCDKALSSKRKLMEHLKKVHMRTEGRVTAERRTGSPHPCPKCHKVLRSDRGLREHIDG